MLAREDFTTVALAYARVIVLEKAVPEAQRTLPPARSLGGVAGGEKYLARPAERTT